MKGTGIKLAVLLTIISVATAACGLSIGGSGNQGGGAPVATLALAEQATVAPTAESTGPYFQEDFTGGLDNWTHFVVNGSKVAKGGVSTLAPGDFGTMSLAVQDGFLVFDLGSPGQWVYAIYNAQTYDDVRVDVSAENRGNNDNAISLVCRYTPDEGWYEVNVANSGLYNIFYAVVKPDKTVVYTRIANGGYNKIRQGKDTNEIGFNCVGRTLTVIINGYQVNQVDDNQFVLKSGKVGVSASSFTHPPNKIQFDWVKTSAP
jgi:hypothetical protein